MTVWLRGSWPLRTVSRMTEVGNRMRSSLNVADAVPRDGSEAM